MDNKREENYELLRILCAIAVISIHVSAKYVLGYNSVNEMDMKDVLFVNAFGIFGIFSVPCFVMISGAFSLKSDNGDYIKYTKRIVEKNGIHILIFSLLYFVFSEIIMYFSGGNMINPLSDLIKGNPYYYVVFVYDDSYMAYYTSHCANKIYIGTKKI